MRGEDEVGPCRTDGSLRTRLHATIRGCEVVSEFRYGCRADMRGRGLDVNGYRKSSEIFFGVRHAAFRTVVRRIRLREGRIIFSVRDSEVQLALVIVGCLWGFFEFRLKIRQREKLKYACVFWGHLAHEFFPPSVIASIDVTHASDLPY